MIKRFIEYLRVERHYSSRTTLAYQRDLYEFCDYLQVLHDDFKPELVNETQIKGWLIEMLDRGVKPRSVKRRMSALHSFWKFLLRIQYTQTDPTQRIITPKMDKPLPTFYKQSEMEQVQSETDWADDFNAVRNNLIIEMFYETGMRRAELLSLTDRDIDFSAMQIRVFGKRKKERIVPIGDSLYVQINEYVDYRDKIVQTPRSNTFFVQQNGKPLSESTLYRIVHNRMSEVSTLKKQSPHVLRHTFATQMLNNGADINVIKELMGHANLAATEIYTHTTFEQIKQTYQKAHPRQNKE